MILHTVVVSYQRLGNLQETLASYFATVTAPHELLVVDNGSDHNVRDWLNKQGLPVLFLEENKYPGYATNRGFELASEDATHFHRSDSDVEYLPGWCEEVERLFASDKQIGQVGLYTNAWEKAPSNVAGTSVIDRSLWQQGLRYREEPWTGPVTEDYWFSTDVTNLGYRWVRVEQPCLIHKATGDLSDPYYQHSYGVRGMTVKR